MLAASFLVYQNFSPAHVGDSNTLSSNPRIISPSRGNGTLENATPESGARTISPILPKKSETRDGIPAGALVPVHVIQATEMKASELADKANQPLTAEEKEYFLSAASGKGVAPAEQRSLLEQLPAGKIREIIKAERAALAPQAADSQSIAAASGGSSSRESSEAVVQAVTESEKVNVYEDLKTKLASDPNYQDSEKLEAERTQRFQAYIDTVHAEEAKALHSAQ